MAQLTTKRRKRLSRGQFALPGRRFPIDTLARARNALSRVSQVGTPEEKRTVARAVRRKFPGLAKRSTFIKRVLKRT